MMLSLNLTFGQANTNQSVGTVVGSITQPIAPFNSEIFRFRTGLVTQLDSGTGFTTSNSQWFALGRVGGTGTTFSQTFYGMRFQQPNRSLLMGYTNSSPNNPVIQWIGTGATLGNLEFRAASAFGATGSPAPDLLVATMRSDGQTVFGSSATAFNSPAKVRVLNDVSNGSGYSSGLFVDNSATQISEAVVGIARNGSQSNYGVLGITFGSGAFEAGIYGETNATNSNQWAGYFEGNVFASNGTFQTSDKKLKENIKSEESILSKVSQLNPVNYNYKKISELNLASGLQHGFVAQELEAVFPELTRDVSKPIFDKERNYISNYEFKSVNYIGMISILTAAIKELNAETIALKAEINDLKTANKIGNNNSSSKTALDGYKLEQNIPNPFQDETQIKYELPNFSANSSIIIFDLNGKLIKEYSLTNKSGIVIVKSSDIGKGLFLYSLVSDGNELITKKMLVK